MQTSKLERRAHRIARQCARIVIALRAEGQVEGAARLEAAAAESIEQMRRSASQKMER
jgi:hypothetical protein